MRRHYSESEVGTYRRMHAMQTVDFVKAQRAHYATPTSRMSVEAALQLLEGMVDESDPDLRDQPQTVHAFQTAERLRRARLSARPVRSVFGEEEWNQLPERARAAYQEGDGTLGGLYGAEMDAWLPLVGLIHDCGKILGVTGELPQWAIVGDTFPVGCAFDPANLFYEQNFWRENPDWRLDTSPHCEPLGMYARHGGLDRLLMSWGHDEYMAAVLERHPRGRLPPEAVYVVRFHSFYPWHTPRAGRRGYTALASDEDWRRLPLLKAFQQCDLYSKGDAPPHIPRLLPHYRRLLDTYLPGELDW